MERRSTTRLSPSTRGVGIRSCQHNILPLIRVTTFKYLGWRANGSHPIDELAFLFRRLLFTRYTMLHPRTVDHWVGETAFIFITAIGLFFIHLEIPLYFLVHSTPPARDPLLSVTALSRRFWGD